MPELIKREIVEPYWTTPDKETVRIYHGDSLDILRRLPSKSVHMVVTSPPYWGLRDYGTGKWEGGKDDCDHVERYFEDVVKKSTIVGIARAGGAQVKQFKDVCKKCGARRVDHQIGAEKSPDCLTQGKAQCGECFVCSLVGIFREVRRVLRNDGTLWLNIGDSYGQLTGNIAGDLITKGRENKGAELSKLYDSMQGRGLKSPLPNGNLIGVPWRVALAMQADGWILRQDIIWSKGQGCMPESVTSRCTKAHEYIFLFSKQTDYYYDHWAIGGKATSEPGSSPWSERKKVGAGTGSNKVNSRAWTFGDGSAGHNLTREDGFLNKRSVWTVTHGGGYTAGHFATYPPALITPCILAGTSEYGACAKCGTPWNRLVDTEKKFRERPNEFVKRIPDHHKKQNIPGQPPQSSKSTLINLCSNTLAGVDVVTVGWTPGCNCKVEEVVPCIVLEPFLGSGTTALVSMDLGRRCWGIDLSEEYLKDHAIPRISAELLKKKDVSERRGVAKAIILGNRPPPRTLEIKRRNT